MVVLLKLMTNDPLSVDVVPLTEILPLNLLSKITPGAISSIVGMCWLLILMQVAGRLFRRFDRQGELLISILFLCLQIVILL